MALTTADGIKIVKPNFKLFAIGGLVAFVATLLIAATGVKYVGSFYGDGTGLTNITANAISTNVVWPVAGNGITGTTNGYSVTLSTSSGLTNAWRKDATNAASTAVAGYVLNRAGSATNLSVRGLKFPISGGNYLIATNYSDHIRLESTENNSYVRFDGGLKVQDAAGSDVVVTLGNDGVVYATSYEGDGSALTGIAGITNNQYLPGLPVANGASFTNLPIMGVTASGSAVATTNSGVVNISVTGAGGDVLASGDNVFTGSNYFSVPPVTSAERMSNVLNSVSVVSFGADPTGVADSASAIQAAIYSVTNNVSRVFFPRGRYRLDSSLLLPTPTVGRYALLGSDATLVWSNSAWGIGMTNYNGGDDVTIEGLRLLGPSAALVSGTEASVGLWLGVPTNASVNCGKRWTIRNCIMSGWGKGLVVSNLWSPLIANCNLESNRLAGISLGGTHAFLIQNCTVIGDDVYRTGSGVECIASWGDDGQISDCFIKYCTNAIKNTELNLTIISPHFEDCGSYITQIGAATSGRVVGGYFLDHAQDWTNGFQGLTLFSSSAAKAFVWDGPIIDGTGGRPAFAITNDGSGAGYITVLSLGNSAYNKLLSGYYDVTNAVYLYACQPDFFQTDGSGHYGLGTTPSIYSSIFKTTTAEFSTSASIGGSWVFSANTVYVGSTDPVTFTTWAGYATNALSLHGNAGVDVGGRLVAKAFTGEGNYITNTSGYSLMSMADTNWILGQLASYGSYIYFGGPTNSFAITNNGESVSRTNVWTGSTAPFLTAGTSSVSGFSANAYVRHEISTNTFTTIESGPVSITSFPFRAGGSGTLSGHYEFYVVTNGVAVELASSATITISATAPTVEETVMVLTNGFSSATPFYVMIAFKIDSAGVGGPVLSWAHGGVYGAHMTFVRPLSSATINISQIAGIGTAAYSNASAFVTPAGQNNFSGSNYFGGNTTLAGDLGVTSLYATNQYTLITNSAIGTDGDGKLVATNLYSFTNGVALWASSIAATNAAFNATNGVLTWPTNMASGNSTNLANLAAMGLATNLMTTNAAIQVVAWSNTLPNIAAIGIATNQTQWIWWDGPSNTLVMDGRSYYFNASTSCAVTNLTMSGIRSTLHILNTNVATAIQAFNTAANVGLLGAISYTGNTNGIAVAAAKEAVFGYFGFSTVKTNYANTVQQ